MDTMGVSVISELNSPDWWDTTGPDRFLINTVFLCFSILFAVWVYLDATEYLIFKSKGRKKNREPKADGQMEWALLLDKADRAVRQTISELPAEMAAEAGKVPCLYAEWSGREDGSKILGIYRGFIPNQISEEGCIVLFLRQLEEYCAEQGSEFETEVRNTYLHELGHHVGWDEPDVESRGL